jgi:hypothetical protein
MPTDLLGNPIKKGAYVLYDGICLGKVMKVNDAALRVWGCTRYYTWSINPSPERLAHPEKIVVIPEKMVPVEVLGMLKGVK